MVRVTIVDGGEWLGADGQRREWALIAASGNGTAYYLGSAREAALETERMVREHQQQTGRDDTLTVKWRRVGPWQTGAPPTEELHQVTMRQASDGEPVPHDVAHPPRCDLLAYGQQCHFDYLTLDVGHPWPDGAGVWAARIVLGREPEPWDTHTEEDEIHYERLGDA